MSLTEADSTNTTAIYWPKQAWLELFGMAFTTDYLILYLIGSISILGGFLNLLSFYILTKRPFNNTQLFQYLKVYVINSSILCFMSSTNFVMTTYYVFDFTNTYSARAYGTFFFIVVVTTAHFYGGVLDIYISLERMFYFIPSLNNWIIKFKYKKVCLILFVAVLVLNFPFFFINSPAFIDVQLNETETFRIWYFGLSSFGMSKAGQITSFVTYSIRDVLTLLVEVVLNMLSVILLKRYIRKKKAVLNAAPNKTESTSNTQTEALPAAAVNRGEVLARLNTNLTIMVFIMCLFSTLAHVFLITCTTNFLFSQDMLACGLCYLANLFVSIKHASNFFIFVFFNSFFRDEFRKLFKKSN